MELKILRQSAKKQFKSTGIDEIDVDFVLAQTLGVPRNELVLVNQISALQARKIEHNLNLRMQHMPVSKIFKRAYFYGRTFKINKFVLSPRQDSEVLVETALNLIKQNNFKTVLDLCTGSGCLAVSIAVNSAASVCAADISAAALKIAQQNAQANGAKIEFVKSNMFKNINKKFDLIVSNPPYIATKEIDFLEDEVKLHDPRLALDGGQNGMKFYKIIHAQARKHLNPGGMLVLEIGNTQKDAVKTLFADFEFVKSLTDLAGRDRGLVFKRSF